MTILTKVEGGFLPAAQQAGHRMGRIVLLLLLLFLVLQASLYIIENWLEVRLPSTSFKIGWR